jgi:transposase
MLDSNSVGSEQLGHLGLVVATIRELGLIERIDSRIALDEQRGGIVSYGCRVAAMVLNGLGFMNSRLYITSHFFEDKPVAQLLGAEIESTHLNDDCLGRCLDKIASYGVTKLYSELAFEIALEKNLLSQRLHLDSTSFVLYGRYDTEEGCPDGIALATPKRIDQKPCNLSRPKLTNIIGSIIPVPR